MAAHAPLPKDALHPAGLSSSTPHPTGQASDPTLLARLREAVRPLRPEEVRAQRISFAASCSDLPRDEVAAIVDRMTGYRT